MNLKPQIKNFQNVRNKQKIRKLTLSYQTIEPKNSSSQQEVSRVFTFQNRSISKKNNKNNKRIYHRWIKNWRWWQTTIRRVKLSSKQTPTHKIVWTLSGRWCGDVVKKKLSVKRNFCPSCYLVGSMPMSHSRSKLKSLSQDSNHKSLISDEMNM